MVEVQEAMKRWLNRVLIEHLTKQVILLNCVRGYICHPPTLFDSIQVDTSSIKIWMVLKDENFSLNLNKKRFIFLTTMGNCKSFRLTDGEKKKLIDFVLDSKGKDGASLHYIISEGDCVLITIQRRINAMNKVFIGIEEYYAYKNGELTYLVYRWISQVLFHSLMKQNFSPVGFMGTEDPTHKARVIFMDNYDAINICGQTPPYLSASELRLAMKNVLNKNNTLEELTK